MRRHGSLTVAILFCLATILAVYAQASLEVIEETVRVNLSPNVLQTTTVGVLNDGTAPITLKFDTSRLDLTDSAGRKISVTFNPATPTLQPNETKTINVDLLAEPFISFEQFGGTVTVLDTTANSSVSDTFELTIDIEPDVCDFGQVGTDLRIDIKDPDSSDDFKPGDVIPIEVKVENEGKNDIRVQVEAFLFNDNRNIADTSSTTQRIEENKDKKFNLKLRIPLDPDDVDEDDDLTLFVKAFDDEFEQLNCVQEEQQIDIKLENDEIIIDQDGSKLFPSVAACGDVVSASVKIVNIGEDDNDNVAISVTNAELNINEESDTFRVEGFNSEEENTAARQFQLNVPANARVKTYDMQAKVDFDGGSDTFILPLDIVSCTAQTQFAGVAASPVEVRPLETALATKQGTITSIPVEISNNQFQRTTFTVTVANVEDFADTTAKTVTINPGAKTTTILDLVTRESAAPGIYSATVFVKEGAEVVASTNVQVQVESAKLAAQKGVSPWVGGIPTSVWIITNIFLLAIVILSVKVVITSLRRSHR